MKIKRFILNMSLSKQVSEFLKLSKESGTYPGSKELGRTVRTQIAMPHPKHALQTLWPFTKIKQSSNSCMWAVILAIVGKNLDKLDFDRIQTCASQILVGRCYKPTRNPHVRSNGNFWEFSFHVETVSFILMKWILFDLRMKIK